MADQGGIAEGNFMWDERREFNSSLRKVAVPALRELGFAFDASRTRASGACARRDGRAPGKPGIIGGHANAGGFSGTHALIPRKRLLDRFKKLIGEALPEELLAVARQVGVLAPERIRIKRVDLVPFPEQALLRQAALQTGMIGFGTAGLTLGYGVFIARRYETVRLLSHGFFACAAI